MHAQFELLLHGNNLSFRGGFFGFCNVALVTSFSGEKILFDTGHYCVRQGLLASLAARSMTPASIDYVFLSHLHFDHCQNLDLFPDATVLVGARELEYAKKPAANDLFVPWKIHSLLDQFQVRALPDEGEIVTGIAHFSVPGHTPGSQAMKFVQADGKKVVLAGDSIKYPKELLAGVGDACFGSAEQSKASIATVISGADIVVPGHFPTLFKRNGTWLWDEPASLELLVR